MHIHKNIRLLRKRHSWTQEQLADQLDKTYITIGDYERGKALPPLNTVLDLCRIFEVDLETLVLRDIEKEGVTSVREELKSLTEKYTTLHHLSALQQHRLAELEREIRRASPELAKKLGLD
jgi:transcriptional regulator with XRE-family HTH domain